MTTCTPHFCMCPKPVFFQRYMKWFNIMFNDLRWKVIVQFGGIIDNHCLYFLFIVKYDWSIFKDDEIICLLQVEGVLALHEFHVWQLAGNKIIASAHIHVHSLQEYMVVAEKIKALFHKAGIHSTTIQPEIIEVSSPGIYCRLDCMVIGFITTYAIIAYHH